MQIDADIHVDLGSETEDTKETVFGLEHAQYGFSIAASREPVSDVTNNSL